MLQHQYATKQLRICARHEVKRNAVLRRPAALDIKARATTAYRRLGQPDMAADCPRTRKVGRLVTDLCIEKTQVDLRAPLRQNGLG